MNVTALKNTAVGRVLGLPLRLIPRDSKMPIMQGPLRGKRWIVGAAQHSCWLGTYEYEMQMAFRAIIKPGDTVYDLGANAGFYSLLASVLVGPSGRVVSFEPAPRNLKFLHQHMQINDVRNCIIYEAAVGGHNGEGNFDFDKDYVSGHLTNDKNAGYNVRIVALDSLIADDQLPPPNLIKCDIEGAEYDALRAASSTLARHMPAIFLSTYTPELHRQCWDLLSDLGYHVSPLEERPNVDYSSQMQRQIRAVRK